MHPINSLRFRVALVFAVFGALLSILLSVDLYVTAQQLGHRLMDEALRAQLEDSVERHATDSIFIPPNTVSIKGFFHSPSGPSHFDPPAEISKLPPGSHNVTVGETDYRVLIADRNGARYFMLFDTEKQHQHEAQFYYFLIYFAVFMTLTSAGGGFWLAARIITPVTRLARQVGQAEPGDTALLVDKLARKDEVGELARAFERYSRRMQEFVARENYFTADVSHELRTPLAIVQGTVEVLEHDKMLSDKQRERVERIKRAAQDMIDLSSALLLLGREYRPAADVPPCYVSDVVDDCVDKHGHLIKNRPIRLELELIDEPYLFVERPLLEVVIGNLLRNAFFNTQAGVVTLRLEAQRLVIKDTGFGMSEEVLARIFERHFKGATSTGAGVGMSLVKRICDRYGWQIAIESQPGKGTTVAVAFEQT
jgi:signal transduction histidine kinase